MPARPSRHGFRGPAAAAAGGHCGWRTAGTPPRSGRSDRSTTYRPHSATSRPGPHRGHVRSPRSAAAAGSASLRRCAPPRRQIPAGRAAPGGSPPVAGPNSQAYGPAGADRGCRPAPGRRDPAAAARRRHRAGHRPPVPASGCQAAGPAASGRHRCAGPAAIASCCRCGPATGRYTAPNRPSGWPGWPSHKNPDRHGCRQAAARCCPPPTNPPSPGCARPSAPGSAPAAVAAAGYCPAPAVAAASGCARWSSPAGWNPAAAATADGWIAPAGWPGAASRTDVPGGQPQASAQTPPPAPRQPPPRHWPLPASVVCRFAARAFRLPLDAACSCDGFQWPTGPSMHEARYNRNPARGWQTRCSHPSPVLRGFTRP